MAVQAKQLVGWRVGWGQDAQVKCVMDTWFFGGCFLRIYGYVVVWRMCSVHIWIRVFLEDVFCAYMDINNRGAKLTLLFRDHIHAHSYSRTLICPNSQQPGASMHPYPHTQTTTRTPVQSHTPTPDTLTSHPCACVRTSEYKSGAVATSISASMAWSKATSESRNLFDTDTFSFTLIDRDSNGV